MKQDQNGENIAFRVLIVESYKNHVKSLSNHIQGLTLPLEIHAVGDGATALKKLEEEDLDLVVIDTCLRGKLDGYELCRTLRSSAKTQHLPIILLLAGYLSLERSKGISAGADLLLHRPVVKEELLKMIQLLLALKLSQTGSARPAATDNSPVRKLYPLRQTGANS